MRGFSSTYPLKNGSIAVVQAASPAGPLNLSAEGTLDWCTTGDQTVVPRLLDRLYYHGKARARGLSLSDSLKWVVQGNWGTFPFIAAGAQPSKTTTDSCGQNETAYAGTMSVQDGSGGFVNIGHGFSLRAMAATTPRVLRVYGGGFQGTIRLYARLSDNSAVEVTDDWVVGLAAYRMWTITYNAARDGQVLEVEVLVNARNGVAFADVRFVAATLALV